jgi:hypothetical protein
MSDGIFLIQGHDLTVLTEAPYETEDVLQKALADFPAVLAGGATRGGGERRLLLIRREKGIPTAEAGSSIFSLDHLFVDPAGVPVVVEVKRSSDTRIRREVVGQMLDYAANGVKYWPVAELRADFEAEVRRKGLKPDQLIEEATLGTEPEEFWRRVEQNLRSGHVRLVFVADRLPDELVRVIEFLNEQMSPAEVLGVEVQQYTDGTTKVLVPRVVGATAAAKATKERSGGTPWNLSTFLAAAMERCPAREVKIFERLFAHAEECGTKMSWGKGVSPGVSGWYLVSGTSRGVWTANAGTGGPDSDAYLYIWLPEIAELVSEEELARFLTVLKKVRAFDSEIASGKHKYPSVNLSAMSDEDVTTFLEAVDTLTQGASGEPGAGPGPPGPT